MSSYLLLLVVPKSCMRYSSPPCVPHALPISYTPRSLSVCSFLQFDDHPIHARTRRVFNRPSSAPILNNTHNYITASFPVNVLRQQTDIHRTVDSTAAGFNQTYFPFSLTPWTTVLLEKLTGSQLVKKFPAFYGTRRFITAFTSAHHLSLSLASSIQSIPPHPTS